MFKYASYFIDDVLAKRPYIERQWCEAVVTTPEYMEKQPDGRVRFWAQVPEFGNRYLRVVTLEDQITILNAFFDRNFKRRP